MIKPQPMKVQCPKCLATTIISPKSDAIIVLRCKKCGGEMEVVGSVGFGDFLKSWFKS